MGTDAISLPPLLNKSDYLEMKSSGLVPLAGYYGGAEKQLPPGKDGVTSFYVPTKIPDAQAGQELGKLLAGVEGDKNRPGGRIVVMHNFPCFYKTFFENPSLMYDDKNDNWYEDIPGQPIDLYPKRPRFYGIGPEDDRQWLRVYNGETQMRVQEYDPNKIKWLPEGDWVTISRSDAHMGAAASQALTEYLHSQSLGSAARSGALACISHHPLELLMVAVRNTD